VCAWIHRGDYGGGEKAVVEVEDGVDGGDGIQGSSTTIEYVCSIGW
jgi:hypothetical protein